MKIAFLKLLELILQLRFTQSEAKGHVPIFLLQISHASGILNHISVMILFIKINTSLVDTYFLNLKNKQFF